MGRGKGSDSPKVSVVCGGGEKVGDGRLNSFVADKVKVIVTIDGKWEKVFRNVRFENNASLGIRVATKNLAKIRKFLLGHLSTDETVQAMLHDVGPAITSHTEMLWEGQWRRVPAEDGDDE